MIKLFIGLGNPGLVYQATRHNAGCWWVDALAQTWGLRFQTDATTSGLYAQGVHNGRLAWLVKSQTNINFSGPAVSHWARALQLTPKEIVVAHDDLDLLPGQLKLKFGGGHAGHNGLRDVHAHLNTSDYWRLRIGVGHPGVKEQVGHWVLGQPSPQDREAIDTAIEHSVKALPAMCQGDMNTATRLINTPAPQLPQQPVLKPAAFKLEGPYL